MPTQWQNIRNAHSECYEKQKKLLFLWEKIIAIFVFFSFQSAKNLDACQVHSLWILHSMKSVPWNCYKTASQE